MSFQDSIVLDPRRALLTAAPFIVLYFLTIYLLERRIKKPAQKKKTVNDLKGTGYYAPMDIPPPDRQVS